VLLVPAVLYFLAAPPPPVDAPEMRLEVNTPPTPDPVSFAISPDGRRLVFVASGDGAPRLWLRPLDAVTAQPLAGTEGATYPFWSPDSRAIGFFAGGKLKRTDIGGSPPQAIADAPSARGGSWNRDGLILFAATSGSVLSRVSASGGEAVAVTRLAPGQSNHRFSHFLPDGRRFLYFAPGSVDTQGVYLGALDSSETTRLTAADTAAAYVPPGYVLYIRQGALVARPFDAASGAVFGDPVTIADPVAFDAALNIGGFSASATGVVAHRVGGSGRRQLTWFDRTGRPTGTVGVIDESALNYPELSLDGRRVAIDRTVQSNRDVWLIDLSRSVPTRFTFDASVDAQPLWSPDGGRIVFSSTRKGSFDLYQKPVTGAENEAVLGEESPQIKFPRDWSPDGRILLHSRTDDRGANLWALPLDGDRKPFPVANTPFEELQGQFSPDGRWVAYQSNESGQNEIYVQPFPGPGGKWQVSTKGGASPRWRHDGQEVFYLAPDATLMAVPIRVRGSSLEQDTPVALFRARIRRGRHACRQHQAAIRRRRGRPLPDKRLG
jgi:Tol biopolymer transport system component